jgi:hypothetical protein
VRENEERAHFALKKRTKFDDTFHTTNMMYWIKRWLHRPTFQLGPMERSRGSDSRLRNPQFASFLSSSGGVSQPGFDRHDARLRRRKLLRGVLTIGFSTALIWVVIESAHALTLF